MDSARTDLCDEENDRKEMLTLNSIPAFYDYVNTYNSSFQPSTSHATETGLSRFFQRYLLQEAISVFKWTMPEMWSKDYFLYTLYTYGFVAIINTNKYGVIPQMCGLRGYDVFYRPTNAIITNPLLTGIIEPRIGTQCTLIKLQPDYGGIMDLVTKYADIMAMTMQTAGCNIQASKLAYVFTAENKAGAESFKKMYDSIASGDAMVVQDAKLKRSDGTSAWEMFTNNLRNNYVAGDMLVDLQKWRNMFCTEIGIPNANTEKKERMLSDEVNANNQETFTKADMWLEELKEGCKQAVDMFPGIELSVDWRFDVSKGGDNNGDNESVITVPV